MSRIRRIAEIGVQDFANIVVVRGRAKRVMWSPFPPSFADDIIMFLSFRLFAKHGKELAVMRNYSLLLADETGEIVYKGLKGGRTGDAIAAGEDIIACGVVKLIQKKPYLLFLKKKSHPSFIIRPSRLTRETAKREPEKDFLARLKREFPEIFDTWKDMAMLLE